MRNSEKPLATYRGKVIKGENVAQTLGYPTANIHCDNLTLEGTYAGKVTVHEVEYNAILYANPKRKILEAHLFEFTGNLYGKDVGIIVLSKIAESKIFTNKQEQIKFIDEVVEDTKRYFKVTKPMFTGIIQKTARVQKVLRKDACLVVDIEKPKAWVFKKGQSVAVNGVCSTVVQSTPTTFQVVYMPETLSKTTMRSLVKSSVVNLERPLKLSDFVDGTLVLGHVDTTVKITKVVNDQSNFELHFELPKSLHSSIKEIGGITIDGVNVTVSRKNKQEFVVSLIPYTLAHTNLGLRAKGDSVNLEIDLFVRYVNQK